ncbi:hypothetical protein [Comamonas sp. JUb58]|uniref:hypothetical protein n=1 Tax=Comamonas sp. JUb58 TaxID=2485114 RepID=UPI001061AB55|nr:hypothetical protein [Comamonas sp. JUb58]TDS82605.1 hypothetical protein EDF71_107241 [Comamonas sp. JUb58]
MSGISMAGIEGQLQALSLVVTQLITTLTPVQAAQVATGLAIDRNALREEGHADTPLAVIETQEQVLDAYLALLSSCARSG